MTACILFHLLLALLDPASSAGGAKAAHGEVCVNVLFGLLHNLRWRGSCEFPKAEIIGSSGRYAVATPAVIQ